VFTFTTLDDAKAIEKYLKQFRNKRVKAVVIGGGLIGVSVTEALVKRGLTVTLVEMKERILNTILDEDASVIVEEKLAQFGVKVITGHSVAEVNGDTAGDDRLDSVTLDNGKRIRCELVIVAIGVSPRTGLAVDAGLKVNRGAVVDRRMATSCPDIFACGDMAEAYDFILGENRITPVWPNAYLGGRIAGFNMADVPAEYPGGTNLNSLKYFGLAVVSAGTVTPPHNDYEILYERRDTVYRKVILKDGFLMGLVFVGDIEKSGFKSALVADDFGLISLPEEIWQPLLKIPPALTTSPPTPMKKLETVTSGE
jgi:NAD(P)H-nitrite reductase large subunit